MDLCSSDLSTCRVPHSLFHADVLNLFDPKFGKKKLCWDVADLLFKVPRCEQSQLARRVAGLRTKEAKQIIAMHLARVPKAQPAVTKETSKPLVQVAAKTKVSPAPVTKPHGVPRAVPRPAAQGKATTVSPKRLELARKRKLAEARGAELMHMRISKDGKIPKHFFLVQ